MQIGHARVSTPDQSLALQRDALRQAGCRQIYEEVISGARVERPVLQQLLTHMRAGDVLLIWRLDRLGRSLRHLLEVVTDLEHRGIGFKSLQENIDTTTSSGKLVFHLFGALAEFERDLIRERTQAGLAAARARGRVGGRPAGLSPTAEATALAAETLHREGTLSVRAIAEKLSIAKSTLYVYLRHRRVPIGPLPHHPPPADSAKSPRTRRPQVSEEPLPSHTALREQLVEAYPPRGLHRQRSSVALGNGAQHRADGPATHRRRHHGRPE
jgi:DNA invertase Pin-like site-specific DNA recombinase